MLIEVTTTSIFNKLIHFLPIFLHIPILSLFRSFFSSFFFFSSSWTSLLFYLSFLPHILLHPHMLAIYFFPFFHTFPSSFANPKCLSP
uniref:Uncharacterized protein n=1 Tax=Anopheles quadriannulatus TaxID=34691 RepID=A0A182XSS7_ANOQN